MKYIFTLLSVLSISLSGIAKELTLKGYIGIEGGESFSYNIVFTDSAGFISGYSLTYIQEEKGVRSAISGFIDSAHQTLSFKELNIVYNHGFHSNNTMCLIDATLKYMPDNAHTGHILKGTYKSADASATYCGMGTVTFLNNEVLNTLFTPVAIKDTAVAKTPIATISKKPAGIRVTEVTYPVNPHPARLSPAEKVTEEITIGVEKTYTWHSDTVLLAVWDGGSIDGDRITILYNSKKVLDNYLLAADKKLLRLPVSPTGTDILVIAANNEGSEPPNTANLLLTDGTQTYSIIAYNSTGNEAVIKIKRAAK
jgi:hypothetical protein